MTAADLLRRAAGKLRETAQAATGATPVDTPWTVEDDPSDAQAPYVVAAFGDHSTAYLAEGFLSREHADFVALMHPPVALALADLLDGTATLREAQPFQLAPEGPGTLNAVARAILREPEEG